MYQDIKFAVHHLIHTPSCRWQNFSMRIESIYFKYKCGAY